MEERVYLTFDNPVQNVKAIQRSADVSEENYHVRIIKENEIKSGYIPVTTWWLLDMVNIVRFIDGDPNVNRESIDFTDV